MDRSEFAARALEIVKRARPLDASVLDEERFCIVSVGPNGTSRAAWLGNPWAEYTAAATDADREAVLARLGRFSQLVDSEESFDEIRVLLRPRIRTRKTFEIDMVQAAEIVAPAGKEVPRPWYRPLADHLGVGLAIDHPDHLQYVTDLSQYPLPEDELFALALDNLRRATKAGLTELGEGVWVGDWGDEFAAERMLLTELWGDFDGQPLVFLPGAERIYVVRSDDREAIRRVLPLVDERLSRPRALLAPGFVFDGEWRAIDQIGFNDEVMSERLTTFLAEGYAIQKELAEKANEGDGEAPFYSSVMALPGGEGGEGVTMCMWTKGQEALLPHTHVVMLFDPDTGPPVLVPWRSFRIRAADCFALVPDLYPPRYKTLSFPSAKVLGDMAEFPYVPKNVAEKTETPSSGSRSAPLREPEVRELAPEPAWTRLSPKMVAIVLIALAVLALVYRLVDSAG